MHVPTLAGPRRRTRRALLAAVLPAALAVTALPSAADASVIDVSIGPFSPNSYRYSGDPGEANALHVSEAQDGSLVFTDSVPLRLVQPEPTGRFVNREAICRRPSIARVVCHADMKLFSIQLGDRADSVFYTASVGTAVNAGEGNDTIFAGVRVDPIMPLINSPHIMEGGPGTDTFTFRAANAPVTATVGDFGKVGVEAIAVPDDIEVLEGSRFADTLFGSETRNDVLRGLDGNDVIGGGGGNDLIDEGSAPNGADFLNGGNGTEDRISYSGRTSGVNVSLNGVRNDGASGEQDDVRPSVEHIVGTNVADTLAGNSLANVIEGLGGVDTIDGREGDDTLFGGSGADTILGQGGIDALFADDGEQDDVDCGGGSDFARLDSGEGSSGCETRTVIGTLRLAPRTLQAEAGKPAHVRLRWRHPRAWRKLRAIELRLTRDELPVGEITIRPRAERIAADGAVALVRRHSRLTHGGRTVTAHMTVRLDESLAGQTLEAEVEATDTRGRRQLERDAGTVRVAR